MNLILEKGSQTISGISRLDSLFAQLKSNPDRESADKIKIKIENLLQKLFKCEVFLELHYVGVHSNNCGVLPIYKGDSLRSLKQTDQSVTLGHIRKLYIILGMQLAMICKPKELTAIFLHEIGHTVNHLELYQQVLNGITGTLLEKLRKLQIIPVVSWFVIPAFIAVSRTFYWTEHIGEYNADKFVTKYGYGDEFIGLLKRLDLEENKNFKRNKLSSFFNYLLDFIFGTSHPSNSDRVKAIEEDIINNYAKHYNSPEIKKILKKEAT